MLLQFKNHSDFRITDFESIINTCTIYILKKQIWKNINNNNKKIAWLHIYLFTHTMIVFCATLIVFPFDSFR